MKIGDAVCVHGYVDEIRNDVVIIRNQGGYFGTIESEIQPERTGRWIKVRVPAYDGGFLTEWECDQCHEHHIIPQKFCGECGARMVGGGA